MFVEKLSISWHTIVYSEQIFIAIELFTSRTLSWYKCNTVVYSLTIAYYYYLECWKALKWCTDIFRRGSWRPIGHMRPSSPLLDSVRDQFEDYDQLAKDFTRMFLNNEANMAANASLFDVVFMVGQSKQKVRFIGVRAILGVRSRLVPEIHTYTKLGLIYRTFRNFSKIHH